MSDHDDVSIIGSSIRISQYECLTPNLMITALATADVVAKILIDKGLVTQKEFDMKLLSERATYQAMLQRVGGTSVDA